MTESVINFPSQAVSDLEKLSDDYGLKVAKAIEREWWGDTVGKYKNNLLIQELTPILQVYTENSAEGTVDGLRLFSKKLQPYDIDLLSDAFMELKEVNPELAKELIIFSVLQSGYEFNPNSFFQVIPGTEVLSFLSKYFKTNKKENRTSNLLNKSNMDNLWDDFHKNYYSDQKIVPNIYMKSVPISKDSGIPTIIRDVNNEYISITTPIGVVNIGGREVTEYTTNLFKAKGKAKNGQTIYTQISTKGVKNNLIEANGTNSPSVVNRNTIIENDFNIIESPEIVNTVLELKTNTAKEVDAAIIDKTCK